MEDEKKRVVTSTSRSPMTVLSIAVGFLGIGIGWVLPLFMEGGSVRTRLILGAFGLFYLLFTVNLVLTYLNKRLTVSVDGVTYVNPLGREARYGWHDVEVHSYSARGWVLVFYLAGKKVKLSGICTNRGELCKLLAELGRY